VGDHSEAVTSDAFGELEILAHDGHTLGVDGAQVSVLEERHQICLSSLLKGKDSLALEADFLFELGGDLAHQSLEGQLADEQIGLNKKEEGERSHPHKGWSQGVLTLFWNFLISLRATVPGLKRWGFLTPETMGADFLAIF
jgi:hypothetical protein